MLKLIIVESPAKAKTIERFLGSDYKVVASYGHIRDLPATATEIPKQYKGESWARLGVNPDDDFSPIYIVPKDSKKRVSELKKMVKEAEELLLATDEDREGESISWHLIEVLKPKIPVRRVAFHEITKGAVLDAVANPREVNEQLVRAQESRRILDRLFGYSLSPVLWKKVRTKLSAGRVQSVAVRLIVEREEERQAFNSATYWDVEATLKDKDGLEFTATLTTRDGKKLAIGKDFDPATGDVKKGSDVLVLDEKAATKVAADSLKNVPWKVISVERKEATQRPWAPFTTSTLQQTAGYRLNMSPKQTMMVAQRLYEGVDLGGSDREGLITYMRTDSVTLSEKALSEAGAFIKKTYGDAYYDGPRRYKTKAKSAQEAHEAIRPTSFSRPPESLAKFLNKDELALYKLIWTRTLASQMADSRTDKMAVDFQVDLDQPHVYRATGSTVKFDGFSKIYGNGKKETLLPALEVNDTVGGKSDNVAVSNTEPKSHKTAPPARYTEGTLVKRLEEEGIGRPSTYAPTIATIQQRNYVVKKSGALVPTYVGMAVTDLLRKHFDHYIDLAFTARMEEALDNIASGNADASAFLSAFYHGNGDSSSTGLIEQIDKQLPDIEFPMISLGNDPDTDEPIFVRIGKSSCYIQRGTKTKAPTAPLPVDLLIDELTLDKAHELLIARLKGDEPLGQEPESGKNIYALVGPYGPYVQLGEADGEKKPKRVSLGKGTNITEVTLEFALKMLSLPRKLGPCPDTGKSVTAGMGPYGPFVHRDGVYRSLKKPEMIFEVTLEEAVKMLAEKKTRTRTKTVLKELGKHPESGKPIQVLDGRYGPYVSDGKVNASLGNRTTPDTVTLETAVEMLAEAATKKKTRRRRG